MWAALARFILKKRLFILILLAVVTAFMAYQASQVEIAYEINKVLPENDSAFIDYKKFRERFGEEGNVMFIGINDKRMDDLSVFNDWYRLTYELKKVKGVEEVISTARLFNLTLNDTTNKFEFKPIAANQPSSQQKIDSIYNVINKLPFYKGFIMNGKNEATLMAITLDNRRMNSKTRLAIVDTIKAKAEAFSQQRQIKLHYSGMPYIRTVFVRKIAHETILFLCLAFVITAIVLLLFFRSFLPVFFSLLIVIIGVIWAIGTLVLFGFKLSALSGLIPPLLIIIGIPNCILLLNKYHVEFNKYRRKKIHALKLTVEKIGISTFFANVTTAIGFGVFCFTNSRVLEEFGLVASINVMGTYVLSLFLIPVVFSYLPAPEKKQVKHIESKYIHAMLSKIDYIVHHRRKTIYVLVGLLVLTSIVGISRIKTVGYVVDDLPKKDPIYVDMKFFEENFNGVIPFEIIIDTKKKGGVFSTATLYKINKLQKIFANYEEFAKPVSLVEALKFAYQASNEGNPKYYILPGSTELNKIKNYLPDGKNKAKQQNRFSAFLDSANQITRVSVQMADIGSVKLKTLFKELKPRIDSIFPAEQYKVTLTGNSVVFLKGNDYLVDNLKESVLLAIVLISLVMTTLFMSFRMVLISILPSLIPLAITAGLMGYFHIPLKPSTILIFSIAFGIASDGNMYFLTKYRQEFLRHHRSISKTVSFTLRETGISMIYTAIILFCGFFVFTASGFGGTVALGMLISVTLLLSYCSNLILLPCFLLSMEKKLTAKAFKREPLFEAYDEEEDINLEKLKSIGTK